MRSIALPRITPAFALAFVALLVALGGTGYAAASISGASLKAHSVTGGKLSSNTLTGAQIKESKLGIVPLASFAQLSGSAKKADLATKALSADTAISADTAKTADKAKTADLATSATTADKAKDADRLGGRLPSDYLRSWQSVPSITVANIAVNNGAEGSAFCDAGQIAVSGGAGWFIAGTDTSIGSATLSSLIPVADPGTGRSGFRGEGKNTSTVARDFKVYVVCMTAG